MQPTANEIWYSLELEGGGDFAVYAFDGEEKVSEPFEFAVELVSRVPDAALASFIGRQAALRIKDKSGDARIVHGFIRQMELLHSSLEYTHYRAIIVPRLWFLSRNRNFRIFQHKSVPDIIDEVLLAQGFDPEFYAIQCHQADERYKEREYCVQYGESDLHFISRLCEEEGIYYYFEHGTSGNSSEDDSAESDGAQYFHKLIFADMPGGENIPGASLLRYHQGSGSVSDAPVVSRLNFSQSVDTDTSSFKEWNFEKPSLNLAVSQSAGGSAESSGGSVAQGVQEASYPEGLQLEDYSYPGLYNLQAAGEHYASLAVLRRLSLEKLLNGQSDASRLTPGFVFSLTGHPNNSLNSSAEGGASADNEKDSAGGTTWWLLSVRHHGEQPQVLREAAPERGMVYNAMFTAIPSTTRYLPPLKHPKARALGTQTAIVTGPEGQEIYTDEYGRVKVKFHWDRLPEQHSQTSCWLRVSQGWAGSGYGSMVIPRIGHEVLVSFLNGDPDRPLVTGRVYYATHMPPYALDEHKSRSVFKSMSTPGAENEERGFNELRIEDMANQEEIYLHAQRDLNAVVLHDYKDHILNERHSTVDGNSYSSTGGEAHEIFKGPRKTEILNSDNLTVSGSSHNKIGSKYLLEAGSEIHQKAGLKLVLEAGTEITLKAGGSYVKIDPSGVSLNGAMISLGGGGAPGSGSGAAPGSPSAAIMPDKAPKPAHVLGAQGAEAGVNSMASVANAETLSTKAPLQRCALQNANAMNSPYATSYENDVL